jgi:uncharacterized protein
MTAAAHHPDFDKAVAFALERLRNELPPTLYYHSAWHTEGDVLPATRRLAELAGVAPTEKGLLEVGAAYHDIGHIRDSRNHEAIGVGMMAESLPRFGFSPREIEIVAALIMATRLPQSPTNELERLLADADLDGLGRPDFLDTSKTLWRELTALGRTQTWAQWLETQLHFLRSHSYFTDTARALREDGKKLNIATLERLILEGQDEPGS